MFHKRHQNEKEIHCERLLTDKSMSPFLYSFRRIGTVLIFMLSCTRASQQRRNRFIMTRRWQVMRNTPQLLSVQHFLTFAYYPTPRAVQAPLRRSRAMNKLSGYSEVCTAGLVIVCKYFYLRRGGVNRCSLFFTCPFIRLSIGDFLTAARSMHSKNSN